MAAPPGGDCCSGIGSAHVERCGAARLGAEIAVGRLAGYRVPDEGVLGGSGSYVVRDDKRGQLPSSVANAAAVRLFGTQLLTVRIDLDA